MKMETDHTGTKNFVLEHSDRFLSWDYVYMRVRLAVLGSVEERTLEDIGTSTGRDARWAYKLINNAKKRLAGQHDDADPADCEYSQAS